MSLSAKIKTSWTLSRGLLLTPNHPEDPVSIEFRQELPGTREHFEFNRPFLELKLGYLVHLHIKTFL